MKRFVATSLLVVGIGMQAVARPNRVNPPVDPSLRLESGPVPQQVAAILRRACYDCHSNETRWPWYSSIAPVSWLVGRDVVQARKLVNFSRWKKYNVFDRADMLDKICDKVTKHEMPLRQYRVVHADARLTDEDVSQICAWTRAEGDRLVQEGK